MTELTLGLPLYKDLGYLAVPENTGIRNRSFFESANPGLYFDKFIDTWAIDSDSCTKQAPTSGNDDSTKSKTGSVRAFFVDVIDYYNDRKIRALLTISLDQYRKRITSLHSTLFSGTSLPPENYRIDFKSDWRFVSGLGNSHPFETGFSWHRTLGVPYLAGSSVKGMLRAWAEQWLGKKEQVERLLGPEKTDNETVGSCGNIIVFDAIPSTPPGLDLDILNPHYKPYYEDYRDPPADYCNPVPVFFLSVAKGAEFTFAIAPRPGAYRYDGSESEKISEELQTVKDWLCGALENLGCGGKTAVGYGRFKAARSLPRESKETWRNATVRLDSGSGRITAFSQGKTAQEMKEANVELKSFVEGLGQRRLKELKKLGIAATVKVSQSGNRYKLVSIESSSIAGSNSEDQ